jgi:hypothetical protein
MIWSAFGLCIGNNTPEASKKVEISTLAKGILAF